MQSDSYYCSPEPIPTLLLSQQSMFQYVTPFANFRKVPLSYGLQYTVGYTFDSSTIDYYFVLG